MEETKRMKPTDKAIFGMASESPGRNASEPSGGLEKIMTPEAELSGSGRRQHDRSRADEAACHAAFARRERARPPEPFFVEATTGFTCVAAR